MRLRTAVPATVGAVLVLVGLVAVVGLAVEQQSSGSSGPSGSAGSAADRGSFAPAAGTEDAPAAPAASSAPGSTSEAGVTAGRDVVRTARLAVTTADPDTAAQRAGDLATAAGGRVDQDTRGGDAHLVLRVPADRLDATLGRLAALGEETSRQVTGDDVTADVADLGARVTALQTSVTRLQTLVSTAGSLDDLLSVETQLTDRQAALESLQAQQRAMADQVSLATIDLDLTTPATVAAATTPTGFGHAVAGGWHAFTTGLRWLLAGLGYALPFLVLGLLVGAGVVLARRRRRPPPVPVDPA